MSDRFITIEKTSEGFFRDRGSKFLAFAYPIRSEDNVKPLIQSLWDEYQGICHVCYAYRIGVNGETYRANDDGEPSGSAGLPILNQIKSKEVTNTLVAVARYFGGTKLGVPGLINAYKESAKEALENAKLVEKVITEMIDLNFPHSSIGEVERLINQRKFNVVSQDFGADCNWKIEVARSELEATLAQLELLTNVNVEVS